MANAVHQPEVTRVVVEERERVTLEMTTQEAAVVERILGLVHGNSLEAYDVWTALNGLNLDRPEGIKVHYRLNVGGGIYRLFAEKEPELPEWERELLGEGEPPF